MILVRLFLEFVRVGLFAIGGGLATLPFLYNMSDSTGWFTYQQLTDMVAVSESTPGPIGVNTATYVGFTTAGVPGAVVATLGLVFPSIVIIIIIVRILDRFKGNKTVEAIFSGLRPASTGLIAAAGIAVAQVTLLNMDAIMAGQWAQGIRFVCLGLGVVLYLSMRRFPKHPAFYIALSAVAGILLRL